MSKCILQPALLSLVCFLVGVLTQTTIYYGTIIGNEYTNYVYSESLGIPYVKAPTPENNLRCESTVKMDSWEQNGSYAATSYGSGCLQPSFGESFNVSVAGSENCLYVNIRVPIGTSSTTGSTCNDMVSWWCILCWFW